MIIPPATVQPVGAKARGAIGRTPSSCAMTKPAATSSDASANAIRRLARRLLTTSSTAATRQVPPRWMAKPISPAQIAASASAPDTGLLRCFAGDGRGDFARHLELRVLAGDAVALTDEREVGVGDFGGAVGGFAPQHPNRPVEARIGVRVDELDAGRRVAKQHAR